MAVLFGGFFRAELREMDSLQSNNLGQQILLFKIEFDPEINAVYNHFLAEVGNVTSKHNGVSRYRFSHDHGAITIKSDNVCLEPRPITLRSDNDFDMPIAVNIKSDSFYPQCSSVM
jgi:hypothetical protein